MDQVLADSFPASDPPSWNLGIARAGPAPYPAHHHDADGTVASASNGTALLAPDRGLLYQSVLTTEVPR